MCAIMWLIDRCLTAQDQQVDAQATLPAAAVSTEGKVGKY